MQSIMFLISLDTHYYSAPTHQSYSYTTTSNFAKLVYRLLNSSKINELIST
jgi:hypothetical protein